MVRKKVIFRGYFLDLHFEGFERFLRPGGHKIEDLMVARVIIFRE